MNDSSPSNAPVPMPAATAVEFRPRNGVMRLYAALFGLLLLLFAALSSGDCYFNYWTFRISIGFFAVSALACGIKWFLLIRRKGYQVSDRKGGYRRLGSIEIPISTGMLGLIFGGWLRGLSTPDHQPQQRHANSLLLGEQRNFPEAVRGQEACSNLRGKRRAF